MKRPLWTVIYAMTVWPFMLWMFDAQGAAWLWEHPAYGLGVAVCTLCGVIFGLLITVSIVSEGVVTGTFAPEAPAFVAYIVLGMAASLVFSLLHMGLLWMLGIPGPALLQTYLGQGMVTVSIPAWAAVAVVHFSAWLGQPQTARRK